MNPAGRVPKRNLDIWAGYVEARGAGVESAEQVPGLATRNRVRKTINEQNPEGFALGLAERILGPLGAQWFYEGESLGYRTIYVWIADRDLMITVQTNSHPPEGTDGLQQSVAGGS